MEDPKILEKCDLVCTYASADEAGKLQCGVHYPNPQPPWCYLNKGKVISPGLLTLVPESERKPVVTSDGRPVKIVVLEDLVDAAAPKGAVEFAQKLKESGHLVIAHITEPTLVVGRGQETLTGKVLAEAVLENEAKPAAESETQAMLNREYPDVTKPIEIETKPVINETKPVESDANFEQILQTVTESKSEPVELNLVPRPAPKPAPLPVELKPAPGTPAPVELKPGADTSELKIVIVVRGEAASTGIQKSGCDPVFFARPAGGMDVAIRALREDLKTAEDRWAVSARNPKAVLPAAPASKPVTTTAVPSAGTYKPATVTPKPAAAPAKPKIQPSMF